jgi:pyrroloquinoline quinone biosynthesis protein B
MRVRLLGTAAGGGFPQWNCNCGSCRGLRAGSVRAQARTQSSVAISADEKRWFLLNVSPDVRVQIEAFPPLLPPCDSRRGTGIEGVLLTNADLDHTLGLLILREGQRLAVHATPAVRRALTDGLNVATVLESYCGLEWHEPPAKLAPLCCADGSPSGLSYAAFPVPGKPPRYRAGRALPDPGDCVGYRLVDETTAGALIYLPDIADLDECAMGQLQRCDALLLDGTFWSEDEMQRMEVGAPSAAEMGHLPVGGAAGSLARIASLPIARRIYVHINNTNPMLNEDSPERAAVLAASAEIGWDGLEIVV